MRKITLILFILVTICYGQDITVVETIQLTPDESTFYFPTFSPDGNKIIFTSANYKGLWLYDLNNRSTTQLNDDEGAGYEPSFSRDGSTIVFRSHQFKKRKKYYSLIIQDLHTRQKSVLLQDLRNLSIPRVINDNIIYKEQSDIKVRPLNNQVSRLNLPELSQPVVFLENEEIILIKNGAKKSLTPMGKGIYVWLSISPDNKKLLFTLGSHGTGISDLDGNILVEFGSGINAPQWSPDGRWILYMNDQDDGHQITSSDLYVVSADGKKTMQLTDTNDLIEMYPCWSPDIKKIVFNSIDGKIFLMTLTFNQSDKVIRQDNKF